MKTQVFSAPLVENDEGREAFELRADDEPICGGIVSSIYPASFEFGERSLPKIALMRSYFDSDYVAQLPADALLVASCSCGSPACGHKWARVETKTDDDVIMLDLYGHQSLKNPKTFHFAAGSFRSGIEEIYKTIQIRGLLDHLKPTKVDQSGAEPIAIAPELKPKP